MKKPIEDLYAIADGRGIIQADEFGYYIYLSLQEAEDALSFHRNLGQWRNAHIYCYHLSGGPYLRTN